jgi:hypothetical protein
MPGAIRPRVSGADGERKQRGGQQKEQQGGERIGAVAHGEAQFALQDGEKRDHR